MRARVSTVSRTVVSLTAIAASVAIAGCSSSTGGSGQAIGGTRSSPASRAELPTATGTASSSSSSPSSGATSSALPTRTVPASTSATAPSSSTGAPVHPAPARPLRTKSVVAPDGGATYVIKVWADRTVTDCAAHAYGAPVIHFLQTHPCYALGQLLATTTVDGRAVGFAQRSIGFKGATADATYRAAGDFIKLVNKDGTGNLNDLLREGYRLPSGPTAVPYPNAFSVLGQDSGVTIVEAWYLHGPTPDNDPALVKMAQDIFLQY